MIRDKRLSTQLLMAMAHISNSPLASHSSLMKNTEGPCPTLMNTGNRVEIEVNTNPLEDEDDGVLVLGIMRDVTERNMAETSLRENEQFLASLLNSIQDGISVLNTDLTIRHVNGMMEKWYSENAPLIGKKCFTCYHNTNKHCDTCPTLRCFQSGKSKDGNRPA